MKNLSRKGLQLVAVISFVTAGSSFAVLPIPDQAAGGSLSSPSQAQLPQQNIASSFNTQAQQLPNTVKNAPQQFQNLQNWGQNLGTEMKNAGTQFNP